MPAPSAYPTGNAFVSSYGAVGFYQPPGARFAYWLSPTSPVKGTAENGTDPGADMASVELATSGVA